MALVIHAPVGNKKNVFKALIAAEYVGVKIELTPSFEIGVTNKTPEFLAFSPLGKVQQTSFCLLQYIYLFSCCCQVQDTYFDAHLHVIFELSPSLCRFRCWKLQKVQLLKAMQLPAMVL
jgi:hypothetical protein